MASTRRRFLLKAAAIGGAAIGSSTRWKFPRTYSSTLTDAEVTGSTSGLQDQERRVPTQSEVEEWYTERRNWARWGSDDQRGAINLITPDKRMAAATAVRSGRTVSLSRVFEPTQQFIRKNDRGRGGRAGSVVDYYGFIYHGQTVTHIDALCHMWDVDGMWQGRDPSTEIDTQGAHFGDITAWSDGIITRGVLLDVPRHRGEPFVTSDRPVHGWELEDIARAEGVELQSGDALMVHSGRGAFEQAGNTFGGGDRPGLHVSCAKFIRDHDVALLGWDMMDARPNDYGLPFPVHGVLFNYGVALLDNALLEPLAVACAEESRYEFMFMALPLKVARGTGSPANPIAMF